ncbi:Transcription factor SPT8 [Wickerhamiella sorbophila]|uniref:Transcription factor SPT8 n=1 Tax=Wickerhamiella sorbophila TaxID=45607 RepID=A0A2T0FEV5_9ASCO|nr:Transcription factor SPT8 [Wickerhamiella sorbophila]PRT53504.1 Transcription factor SPT8 [Wickerhamiella sorbophila]
MELYNEDDLFEDAEDDNEEPDGVADASEEQAGDVMAENSDDEMEMGEDDDEDDDDEEDDDGEAGQEEVGDAEEPEDSAPIDIPTLKAPTEEIEVTATKFRDRYPVKPDQSLLDAKVYDVVPTMAFVHGCSVFSMDASWGGKWFFTGGEDGFIRRYNLADTVNGKQTLTVGQRHAFSDSVTKAGVLTSYFENEQPLPKLEYKPDAENNYMPKLSPVFSLAVQSEALWLCSGLQSGGISIVSTRYGEGNIIAYLDGHKNTVSELRLSGQETHLLSGSWDKTVKYWDLEGGKVVHTYSNMNGQVSTIAWQPVGGPLLQPDDDKSMGSLFGSDEEPAEEAGNNEETTTAKENTGSSFLSTTMTGHVDVWDTRSTSVCLQTAGSTAPPWCMSACWSVDGKLIYAGRRNSTVEEYDVRKASTPVRSLKFPQISGAVTCVLAMPNGRGLMCASSDNVRLYDLQASDKRTPFVLVPGYHGSLIGRMYLDPSGRYLITASGGRGWLESGGDVVLGYEISRES